jgi:Lrp/AsnC family transcriptional regulator, regulator for asnA, asnC and gidA
MKDLLSIDSVQKFLNATTKDIERYFGSDKACIVYLRPDGEFYGLGLYEYLKKKKKNIELATMHDDGEGLEEKKAQGAKVLLVDNDIVSGKGYKRAMETMRSLRDTLQIKDVKFAVYADRLGLADFAVTGYSAEAMWRIDVIDAIDLKIIKHLSEDGRRSFVDIGKSVKLSAVAVKSRVDKLLKEKTLQVSGMLQIDQFYTVSAQIHLAVDPKSVPTLMKRLLQAHEVYHVVRVAGQYNVNVGVLARNLPNIEQFIEREIRSVPGVQQMRVVVGEAPLMPKTFLVK